MNILLHSENIIQLFCYNVPVLAVLYKLNRRVFITKESSAVKLLVLRYLDFLSTEHLSETDSQGRSRPGVRLRDSWPYEQKDFGSAQGVFEFLV